MIVYNPDRQQYEAWYINWLGEPIMTAAIYQGAAPASIALWEREWERRTKELQELHDLIKASQLAKYDSTYQFTDYE